MLIWSLKSPLFASFKFTRWFNGDFDAGNDDLHRFMLAMARAQNILFAYLPGSKIKASPAFDLVALLFMAIFSLGHHCNEGLCPLQTGKRLGLPSESPRLPKCYATAVQTSETRKIK